MSIIQSLRRVLVSHLKLLRVEVLTIFSYSFYVRLTHLDQEDVLSNDGKEYVGEVSSVQNGHLHGFLLSKKCKRCAHVWPMSTERF